MPNLPKTSKNLPKNTQCENYIFYQDKCDECKKAKMTQTTNPVSKTSPGGSQRAKRRPLGAVYNWPGKGNKESCHCPLCEWSYCIKCGQKLKPFKKQAHTYFCRCSPKVLISNV